MAHNIISFEERVKALKKRRPDLADKDMTKSCNLDVDAFESLFSPLVSAEEFHSRLQKEIDEERQFIERFLATLSDEEKTTLLPKAKFLKFEDEMVVVVPISDDD